MHAADAGRLLEQATALLGLGLDDEADLTLADDGRALRPGARIGEEELDVAGAHLAAVQAEERAGAPADAPADLQLLGVRQDVDGGFARGLRRPLQPERHLGEVEGGAHRRAAEDDVIHLAAAQPPGRALAHDPAQRLDDVRLAAAVRPDDAGQAVPDIQLGRIAERLEAADAETHEFQGAGHNIW
ncbi:MAG: hypothetical protein R3C69_11565 [Geminicoccaceae bacterium]